MILYHKFKFFAFAGLVVLLASCSTERLATQNADDVYFKDVDAVPVTYTNTSERSYKEGEYTDRNGYDRNDDYYYDRYENESRFDRDNWRNNYSWRDYYYMDRYGYDPFYGPYFDLGFNNFYGSGWGLSFGYRSPFFSYSMPFYGYSYYDPFYRPYGYGGI